MAAAGRGDADADRRRRAERPERAHGHRRYGAATAVWPVFRSTRAPRASAWIAVPCVIPLIHGGVPPPKLK